MHCRLQSATKMLVIYIVPNKRDGLSHTVTSKSGVLIVMNKVEATTLLIVFIQSLKKNKVTDLRMNKTNKIISNCFIQIWITILEAIFCPYFGRQIP